MDSYISAQFLNKANIGWNRWINIFIYDSILISTTKYKLWSDRYKWKLLETCIPSFFSSSFLSLASSRSLRLLASSRTLRLLLFSSSLLFSSLSFSFFFPPFFGISYCCSTGMNREPMIQAEVNYSFFFLKDGFNGGRTSKEPIANNYSNNKNKNCSAC